MRRHGERNRRLFLADDALHHALARVQAAFPRFTYGSEYDRNSDVVHCIAVRLLRAGLLSSSAPFNALRLPVVHHRRFVIHARRQVMDKPIGE